jgi:hypothetical protein
MRPLMFAALLATPALASDLPARAPGLWESRAQSADVISTVRQCVDEASERASREAGGPPRTVERTAEGWRVESVQREGDLERRETSVVTGDFGSALRIQTVTVETGGPKGTVERRADVSAKWLGPCEPGQRPGDVILPDGRVVPGPR